jgi:hypothetical protein
VAHTCNPSYLGGRDQEDSRSKPAQTKRAVGVAQSVSPEFKPQYCKKKKKKSKLYSQKSGQLLPGATGRSRGLNIQDHRGPLEDGTVYIF